MYKKDDEVYVVHGYYPEDVVINVLTVIQELDGEIWAKDEENNSFLLDISSVIPNYKAAVEKALELTELSIKDLQTEILCQKDFKRELKLELAKIKQRKKK